MSGSPADIDATKSRMLQIGEVADRVGLSLRTVRYYEETGLLEPEARSHGGFRLYTEGHVERLELIMLMKPLRFSVQEMRNLLDARDALTERPADDRARRQVAAFAATVTDRCEALRGQLARSEELATRLQSESASRPHSSASTRP